MLTTIPCCICYVFYALLQGFLCRYFLQLPVSVWFSFIICFYLSSVPRGFLHIRQLFYCPLFLVVSVQLCATPVRLFFSCFISGDSISVSWSIFPAEASSALLTSMFLMAIRQISALSGAMVCHTVSDMILDSLWNSSMSMLFQFGQVASEGAFESFSNLGCQFVRLFVCFESVSEWSCSSE